MTILHVEDICLLYTLHVYTKFLGLIFDKKLSFVPHLQYLRKKCMKALNLLRVVAHSRWGSDENTLLHLYRSLIRSKLDYGAACMVLLANPIFVCWNQSKIRLYAFAKVLSGHPQLQVCISKCHRGLVFATPSHWWHSRFLLRNHIEGLS